MKNKGQVGILHITDSHFGHNRNSTEHITRSIMTMILENDKDISKNIDILVFGGDEYDDLMVVNSEDFRYSMIFYAFIAKYCLKNNIKIRAIEGTNSHSYKQLKSIESIFTSQDGLDFKYIEHLDIEYIPDLDINILYVPDELNGNDSSITVKEIKKMMSIKKLTKVDIAITHGFYKNQLPMVESKAAHSEQDFLDIVTHYIFNGHVHTRSVYDRIITTGTPDRLKHGEEEDKGITYAIMNLKDRTKDMHRFIVNKYAIIFKTIKVETESLLELKEILKKELKSIPRDSFIRLFVDKDNNVIKNNLLELKKTFKYYNFTEEKISKSKISIVENKLLERKVLETINIDKGNIIPLLMEKIGDKIKGDDIIELEKELKALL